MPGRHVFFFTGFALLTLFGCGRQRESAGLRLGYNPGPLAAVVYHAEDAFEPMPFQSPGDVGIALLAGSLDLGFVETTRAAALLRSSKDLEPLAAVTLPFGASVVLHKDLDLRIDELAGRRIAVMGGRCRFLHQFLADAERFGIDADAITWITLPTDQMLPALEAGELDALLTRGAHAMLAVAQGHPVIYQNWDVTGDDTCCPTTLAQVEFVLIARTAVLEDPRLEDLLAALDAANTAPADGLREVVASRTRIPLEVLTEFPVPGFELLTLEQRDALAPNPVPTP